MAGTELEIGPRTVLCLHPLDLHPDGADIVISSPLSRTHMSLSAEAAPLLERLRGGGTVGEVMAEFRLDPDTARDLVQCLVDCGFVQGVDGRPLAPGAGAQGAGPPRRGLRTFGTSRLDPAKLRWLLSWPVVAFCAACTVFWLAVMALCPPYRPLPANYFFSSSLCVSVLGNFLLGWALTILHEGAHMLAARARGLTGSFSLGYRQFLLVAQTDITDVWRLPRRLRYAPYLAGLALESVMLTVLLGVLLLHDNGIVSVGGLRPLLLALVYTRVVGVMWQFRFNMQTDIYYVVGNILDHKNLMEDARACAAWLWARLRRRPTSPLRLRPRELWTAYAYLAFAVVTNALLWVTFLFVMLPVVLRILWQGALSAYQGVVTARPLLFLDGALILAVMLFTRGTPFVLWFLGRRRQRAAPPGVEVVYRGAPPAPVPPAGGGGD